MNIYKDSELSILLVENNYKTSDLVKIVLESAGYRCDVTDTAKEAFEMIKAGINEKRPYDIVLLDLHLNDESHGYEVLQNMRKISVDTPVLILSGVGDYNEKLRGFNLGADDFLCKPFGRQELIARIKAVKRRSSNIKGPVINVAKDFSIDIDSGIVRIKNELFNVTSTEYSILHIFAKKMGKVISKTDLFEFLYPSEEKEPISAKIIDVYICKLRTKISEAFNDEDAGKNIIQTVWGRGYMIKKENTKDSPEQIKATIDNFKKKKTSKMVENHVS